MLSIYNNFLPDFRVDFVVILVEMDIITIIRVSMEKCISCTRIHIPTVNDKRFKYRGDFSMCAPANSRTTEITPKFRNRRSPNTFAKCSWQS